MEPWPSNSKQPCAVTSASLCSRLLREAGLLVRRELDGARALYLPEAPHMPQARSPPGAPSPPEVKSPPEVSYLLEVQAFRAASGYAELPYTDHRTGPRGDDRCGGWAHGTQAASSGSMGDKWGEHWRPSQHRAESPDRVTEGQGQVWMLLACLCAVGTAGHVMCSGGWHW